jgi:exonuclease SbcD
MRLVHSADWHLGQTFGPFSRDVEHAAFLAWLLDVLEEERADALLVCGDVFETGNPPPLAQHRYYDFLAAARARLPALAIVVIGGNHDAPHRLDAPAPVLAHLGVHVVGALPRHGDGAVDLERCVIPLRGSSGDVEALVAAVPFLRVADLDAAAPAGTTGDPVIDGVMAAYARVLDGARARAHTGAALIALGHCYMAGARLTDESERPIFGNAHALPVEMFPDDVTYAALGHLHCAQMVGDNGRVRYSGSPIPLSMTERAYRHAINVIDVEGRALTVRARAVPRTVDLMRVGDEHEPLDTVLDRLRALELPMHVDDHETRPFLEVRVRLQAPTPDVRARVEAALEGKPVRLLRLHVQLAGDGGALADAAPPALLGDIEPSHVLQRLYRRTFGGDVPPPLASAFDELLEEVRAEGVDSSAACTAAAWVAADGSMAPSSEPVAP